MAVAANQVISRKGRDGKLGHAGVAAGTHLYEGTLAFADAGGYATDVKVDANTVFLGLVRYEVDNSAGANGEKSVEFFRDGEAKLSSSGLSQADLGADLHATDNFTTTKTATANPKVGTITEFVSATEAFVEIKGLGEA